MDKIEQIESKIKHWEAIYEKRTALPFSIIARKVEGIIKGLKIALEIINRPPNKKLQIGACTYDQESCGYMNGGFCDIACAGFKRRTTD